MSRVNLKRFCVLALLSLGAHSAPADVLTWTGNGSNSFLDSDSWNGSFPGQTPSTGDSLVFTSGGTAGPFLNNDLTTEGYFFQGIRFQGTEAFVLGNGTAAENAGNPFTLNGDIVNETSLIQTISLPFIIAGNQKFLNTGNGGLRFTGAIAPTLDTITTTGLIELSGSHASISSPVNVGGALAFDHSNTKEHAFTIHGGGQVILRGGGRLVLSNGGNDYSGGTVIESGTLELQGLSQTSGTGAGMTLLSAANGLGPVQVASGASLEINTAGIAIGGLTGTGSITGSGQILTLVPQGVPSFSGTTTGVTLRIVGSGTQTLAGSMENASIHLDGGSMQLGDGVEPITIQGETGAAGRSLVITGETVGSDGMRTDIYITPLPGEPGKTPISVSQTSDLAVPTSVSVIGGAGGAGGNGDSVRNGTIYETIDPRGGGAGGAAVLFDSTGSLTNRGQIVGGTGGNGGEIPAGSKQTSNQIEPGGEGGAGAVIQSGTLYNQEGGSIEGGRGGIGASPGISRLVPQDWEPLFQDGHAGAGGKGGVGVEVKNHAALHNLGSIQGGTGGLGHDGMTPEYWPTDESEYGQRPWGGAGEAGAGAAGVVFASTGVFSNGGTIQGGDAGSAGKGMHEGNQFGAEGGVGVDFQSGGAYSNDGIIAGGAGSHGRISEPYFLGEAPGERGGGSGGDGGASVILRAGGSFVNNALVQGGNGGDGGPATTNQGGNAGNGGAGVQFLATGFLENNGTILGGSGGQAGDGFYLGTPGDAGSAVIMTGGGTVINRGVIAAGTVGLPGVATVPSSFAADPGFSVKVRGGAAFLENHATGVIRGDVSLDNFANQVTLETGSRIKGALDINASPGSTLTLTGSGDATWSEAVTGTLTFAGSLEKTGSGSWKIDANLAIRGMTVKAGTLVVNNLVQTGYGVEVRAGATFGGSVRLEGGGIYGAGMIDPGGSKMMSAPNIDPSGGLDFTFRFTQADPNYYGADSSGNDVLRLSAATPINSAFTAENIFTLDFSALVLSEGQVFRGGIFMHALGFESLLDDATFIYTGLNGASMRYDGFVWEEGNFATNPSTGGMVMQFTVVPEPSTTTLLLIVGLGLFLRRRRSGKW